MGIVIPNHPRHARQRKPHRPPQRHRDVIPEAFIPFRHRDQRRHHEERASCRDEEIHVDEIVDVGHGFEIFEGIFGRAGFVGGRGLDCGFGAFDVEVFERCRLERGEDIGGGVARGGAVGVAAGGESGEEGGDIVFAGVGAEIRVHV